MSSDDPNSFAGRVYDPDVDAGGEDLTADQKEQLKAALDDIAAGSDALADEIDEPEELDTEGALVASEGEDAARAAVSAQIPQHAEPKTREIGKIALGPVDRSKRAVTARINRPAAKPDEQRQEEAKAAPPGGGDHRAKIAAGVAALAVVAGIVWVMKPSARTESPSTSTAGSAPAASIPTPSRSALVATESTPATSASTALASSASTTHSLATSAPEPTTAPTTTPTAKHTTTRVSPTTKPASSKPAATTTTSPWGSLGDD